MAAVQGKDDTERIAVMIRMYSSSIHRTISSVKWAERNVTPPKKKMKTEVVKCQKFYWCPGQLHLAVLIAFKQVITQRAEV